MSVKRERNKGYWSRQRKEGRTLGSERWWRVRNDRRRAWKDENEMRKGGKEREMTEIDGSLLRGARYCVCCSLATMKVNRGCHDIEAEDKMDERRDEAHGDGWNVGWKSETALPLILVDGTDYGVHFNRTNRWNVLKLENIPSVIRVVT